MAEPIAIAVVGHTNAGKTSLLRTLTRRADFGTVDERPGTTRHVEAIELVIDGVPAIRFHDTPGLEDSVALLERLQAGDPTLRPPERIRALLASAEAQGRFEQEAKVLRTLLAVDAAFHVIDAREPVLPKHRAELEILRWCARPVLPVLNFVRDAASRADEWTAALADHGLHAVVPFDAVAPFVGADQRLYADLGKLLRGHDDTLAAVRDHLELQRLDRRAASHALIADLLLAVAAARHTVHKQDLADEARRRALVDEFRAGIVERARHAITALLQVHAFEHTEARLELAPWLDGRWAADLFHPATLARAGRALGAGALIGAGVGLVADVALHGLSLGTGTAIGAAIGGAASQGFGAVGRVIGDVLRGRVPLSVEDGVLVVLADQMLALLLALERRGHAAAGEVTPGSGLEPADEAALRPLLAALAPARAHPEWADGPGPAAGTDVRRDQAHAATVAALRAWLQRREAA